MATISKLLETIHSSKSLKELKHHKLFEYDPELKAWVRLEHEDTGENVVDEESVVIEKEQDGYWFAW